MSDKPKNKELRYYNIRTSSGGSITIPVDGVLDGDIYGKSTLVIAGMLFNTRNIDWILPAVPPKDIGGVVAPLKPAEIKRKKELLEEKEIKNPESTLDRVKQTYKKAEEKGDEAI